MNLSNETLAILKNCASINSNIVIRKGNNIKTIAEAKNIVASAIVSENFEDEFGIYDLNEFLNVYGMFDSPNLEFDPDMNFVEIAEGKRSLKYFFSSPSLLTSPPADKKIEMPSVDLSFRLLNEDLTSIRKAASALGVGDLVIVPQDGKIVGIVTDVKDNTANAFKVALGDIDEGLKFKFVFTIANFKVMSDDYDVEISSKLISKFAGVNNDIEYFIALEKTSTFGE